MTKAQFKLQKVITFINESTSHFRVKDMKKYINDGFQLYENTIYTYVSQLCICEYIKRINTGVYVKLKDIPTDLKAYRLAYMAYDKDYRLAQERKKKINNIMNND